MIRVVIADDHAIVRAGLIKVFATTPDVQVVGEADSFSAIQAVLRQEVVDLLVLDVSMPGVSGIDCVNRLHHEYPDLKIVNLTMHHDAKLASHLMNAGAHGYVTKGSDVGILLDAVRSVAAGGDFCDPVLAAEMQQNQLNQTQAGKALSNREYDVLRHLKSGKALSEIARILHISPKTVGTHKARIMEKLGVSTNADLIRYDMGMGGQAGVRQPAADR